MTEKDFDMNNVTVMIIDDDELDHYIYQRVMMQSGRITNIVSYSCALNALEYLKQDDSERIDVIILDMKMPRMNGYEFLEAADEQLGTTYAGAVVVMLTALIAEQDKQVAFQYDIVKKSMEKPLTIDDINYIVDELVHGSQKISIAN